MSKKSLLKKIDDWSGAILGVVVVLLVVFQSNSILVKLFTIFMAVLLIWGSIERHHGIYPSKEKKIGEYEIDLGKIFKTKKRKNDNSTS